MAARYKSLADYFDRSGETQDELAARLGISQASISEALRGRGSYQRLMLIAEATDVPLASFAKAKAA